MTHYVIVSEANYHSMLVYAKSQAALTTAKPNAGGFVIFGVDGEDFVYEMF